MENCLNYAPTFMRREISDLDMDRRYLDTPRILINKTVMGLFRPKAPSRILVVEMVYFAIVYVSFYIFSISNPLIVFSLNARPILGFNPVSSSVGLFDCGGVNSVASCPLSTSNYYLAILISYLSAVTIPKLSVTYFLVTLTFADFLLTRFPGPFSLLKTRFTKNQHVLVIFQWMHYSLGQIFLRPVQSPE
jgi:hypothetical protein